MVPEMSRLLRRMTFLILALAGTATEVAADDTRPLVQSLGMALIWTALAGGMSWLIPVPRDARKVPPRWVFMVLLALTAAPFLVEPARRHWLAQGMPLELRMVLALRNLGLGLAALGAWQVCLRMAAVVSLFLILFSVAMTDHSAALTLVGLYSAAGSVWLTLMYWGELRKACTTLHDAKVEVERGRVRMPWLHLTALLILLGAVGGLVVVRPQRAAQILGEWLPTSGGTGESDPFARGGLNDGDDEMSGLNAKSTGFAGKDSFLDSPLPSLYDMFNDRYGKPYIPKEIEHAIAIDGNKADPKHAKGDDLRPKREFPTTRHSPKRTGDPSTGAGRAIFEVEGRTPLHIRMTAFNRFDGIAWQEEPADITSCYLDRENPNGSWMRLRQMPPATAFTSEEEHTIRVARTGGFVVPTPQYLTCFRIGPVNQSNFFSFGPQRILRLAQRKLPSGVTIETESRSVDPQRLDKVYFPNGENERRPEYTSLPPSINDQVTSLARQWTAGMPAGWAQIDAVTQKLRAEYVNDATISVPENCTTPLSYFLLTSKRGPDYQFATAAAVLLRSLGYRTRVVSGFYASPERYDRETRSTPVVEQDLHFWPEVMLSAGEWLVLEPTPGYDVLAPNRTLLQRFWAAIVSAVTWASRHPLGTGFCAIAITLVWLRRRQIIDFMLSTSFRWFPASSWQRCVGRTIWLLERRGRWAGRARPVFRTSVRWLREVMPEADNVIPELSNAVEWAAYGPDHSPPWPDDDVRRLCRRALDQWSLRRLRQSGQSRNLVGI